MKPSPIIENEALLRAALRHWPQYQLGAVCTCGAVLPAGSMPGHVGGSNRRWTIKAGFQDRHEVAGYTLVIGGDGPDPWAQGGVS